MKFTRFFPLMLVLFLAQDPLSAQHRTADSIVHKLFASLQQKDEKAFLALYPDADQFGRFVKNIMEQMMKSDAMKQIFALDEKTKNINIDSLIKVEAEKATSPREFEAMQAKQKRSFHQMLEKGEAKGVDWSKIRLINFTIDSTSASNKEAERFNLGGLKEAKGVIDFSVGDSTYHLSFAKMMYFPAEGGWFGADISQVARKGESLVPDASDNEMETDSVVTITSEAERTPPPPPPAKKPAAKSKQKTPARKPKS